MQAVFILFLTGCICDENEESSHDIHSIMPAVPWTNIFGHLVERIGISFIVKHTYFVRIF